MGVRSRKKIWMAAGQVATAALAGLIVLFWAMPGARADGAMTAHRISQLYHAYYGLGVADYCGLVSWEVNDGYERQIRYFLLTADIDKETERRLRISGSVEADYQFDNHGLGGFRGWCARDGRRAEHEFLAFRAQQVRVPRD
jgi:hypothetical protein